MKISSNKALRALFFLALVCLIVVIVATVRLQIKYEALYYIFPPNGYFEPLVNEQIDLGAKGSKYSIPLRFKYLRVHGMGIYADDRGNASVFQDFFGRSEMNQKPLVRLKVRIYDENGGLLKSELLGEKRSVASVRWGDGFDLLMFEVPEYLPRRKNLKLEIEVVEADKDFHEKYGPFRFVIAKMGYE